MFIDCQKINVAIAGSWAAQNFGEMAVICYPEFVPIRSRVLFTSPGVSRLGWRRGNHGIVRPVYGLLFYTSSH